MLFFINSLGPITGSYVLMALAPLLQSTCGAVVVDTCLGRGKGMQGENKVVFR